MITPEQVKHIAKLARLGLKEDDVEKFAKQLSSIMEYVEKLNEVDVKDVQPTSQVTGLENVMREDVESRFSNREDLLKSTELPVQNDQIQVKSVITM
jgi:aspartyl-tRNA(Asn)/glutamyl-tRNA(Gln) amidotransferase subunit C